MDKFDLKKFLIENKLTQLGRLSENYPSMEAHNAVPPVAPGNDLGSKQVNISSIEINGVSRADYPDFADAYIEYAEYEDGTELTPEELDKYQSENPDLVHELIFDRQLYLEDTSATVAEEGEVVKPDMNLGEEMPTEEVTEDFSKYTSVEELMKEIESSTNEAAHKHKMDRVKKAYETLEATATSLEEGDHASYISPAKLKEMKTSAKKLRKMHESLVKEYDKKFAKKKSNKGISLQEVLSVAAHDRMHSLTPASMLTDMKVAVKGIAEDLLEEGFEVEEVAEFLKDQINGMLR